MLLFFGLSGCMPKIYPPGVKNHTGEISSGIFTTADGINLPLRQWLPDSEPKAVLIALHGFNDYSHFFERPGRFLRDHGIACFAYDQRGFGASPHRGLWAGEEAYTDDLKLIASLLKQRYPNRPIYLLGESMGGAVVINAMSKAMVPDIDGIILSAPALWARSSMPWYQTGLLWTLAHSLPWLKLTGSNIRVMPSDNIEMLRALGRDPWVIKGTRVETIYGLANLMDKAYGSASQLNGHTLMLYGEKDEIIPKKPTYEFLQKFLSSNTADKKVAFYQQGYHMLLRDMQASTTWKDIEAWIHDSLKKLPSGADHRAQEVLAQIVSQTVAK
jgi:alpha-beta hydrolase superfamily lysophospholipase